MLKNITVIIFINWNTSDLLVNYYNNCTKTFGQRLLEEQRKEKNQNKEILNAKSHARYILFYLLGY